MEEVNLTEMFESHSKTDAPVHRSISRKISVAPMMDWTDEVNVVFRNKRLWGFKSLVAFW